MAIQTPEAQRSSPAPAADRAAGQDAAQAEFAGLNRVMYAGLAVGAGIFLASMAGFWVSPGPFWVFTAVAGFGVAALIWLVCLALAMRRAGRGLFTLRCARNDRPSATGAAQSGR